MINSYYVLTQEFCETYDDHRKGCNIFGWTNTADGRYVCSTNSSIDFPDLFAGKNFPIVELTTADFPIPLPIIPKL